MKTKIIVSIMMGMLYTISTITAQTYYYNTTKTFKENGYTYQCDKLNGGALVTLYNKNNLYTHTLSYVYKDGSTITDVNILQGNVSLIVNDNWTRPKCISIVNSSFSSSEKARVKGKKFDVSMTIDTSTGKVTEVDFRFIYNDSFGTIPVSTYRKIELALKSQIWFTMTDVGKQLKFVNVGWMHNVE